MTKITDKIQEAYKEVGDMVGTIILAIHRAEVTEEEILAQPGSGYEFVKHASEFAKGKKK